MLDLGAWASGDYKMPGETDEYEEETEGKGGINGGLI